ncbi:MAG: hypothetical protein K9L89_01440, partial [Kiritimatiellales bacterium]|nr:hypothetical protein [Kiritimatiellales bacterium]
FQRPFFEGYRLSPGFDAWLRDVDAAFDETRCEAVEPKQLIPRRVALSDFKTKPVLRCVGSGAVAYAEKPEVDRSRFWWMNEAKRAKLEAFSPAEFEFDILKTYQACTYSAEVHQDLPLEMPLGFAPNSYRMMDFGINCSGFVGTEVECGAPVRLMLVFDEVLIDGEIGIERNDTINLVYYELEAGRYILESIEPYTFRYMKVVVLDGAATVSGLHVREYVNPEAERGTFSSSDPALNQLFEAGRETFRQNAVDIYMDCPGRERAGWLCDSFFTGRVEPLLCGGSKVERNFLENFMLPERFKNIPAGMLPMCYPSEHPDGQHIPQWAMWLVLELEEYLPRTGDHVLVERMQSKVFALLDYFKGFENSDGLLEKLPGWNFIEWSQANKLTTDVNYPTNMLYARMLESAARLYAKSELLEKAKQIHQTVREQSFSGTFFVDNSVRDAAGVLQPSGESTEVCQYYAFFCGTATPETCSNLWKILMEEFGPSRQPGGLYDAVWPANAFIGYYLRMELLSRHGEAARLMDEIKGYFIGMAQTTGTLWEHNDTRASCNHGFASHICVHLYRDVLGLASIDAVNKTVGIKVPENLPLDGCAGKVPVADGWIELEWKRGTDGSVQKTVHVPAGWHVMEQK